MKLYLLRHADADRPNWSGSDDDRPLTTKGRKQAQRVAKFLSNVGIGSTAVLSSPLPRAFQTAEIVSEVLRLRLRISPILTSGFNFRGLRDILAQQDGRDLMLVGHEPDFSTIIRQLTGANLRLPKAGLVRVDLEESENDGQLIWLMPPKLTVGN